MKHFIDIENPKNHKGVVDEETPLKFALEIVSNEDLTLNFYLTSKYI
jgi:hypothetical protein